MEKQEKTLKQVPNYNFKCPLSYALLLTGSLFDSGAVRHPISSSFCEIMNVDHHTFRAGNHVCIVYLLRIPANARAMAGMRTQPITVTT